jgi:lipid II:glycine glycyltransferase (peptidoglycan interpeptide bridge formation enzyme)
VQPRDVEAVLAKLSADRLLRAAIRPNPLHASAWGGALPGWTRVARSAQVVDLRNGADAVWQRMHPNARRAVRRAEREGVEVSCDSAGTTLGAFFDLMHESRARWAEQRNEPVWLARLRARRDSLARWTKIAAAIDGRCRVYSATWNGRLVAGIIVLFGPNAHYTRGAMHKELAAQCRANYALHWRSICDAVAAGFSAYHMGESGTSSSLARFKSQFGAATHPYAALQHESLPISTVDARARALVKRAIAFREAS